MEISVFGAGYVGLVSSAGMASFGHRTHLIDVSETKINSLKEGKIPFYEPGLQELVNGARKKGLIHFHTNNPEAILPKLEACGAYFIAVGTPEGKDGYPDLEHVMDVVDRLAQCPGDMKDKLVIIKSTVPVGTGDKIEERFRQKNKSPTVISNPEFLKQGNAVRDFLKPERIIVGTDDDQARVMMHEIYQPFMLKSDRIIFMSRRSAELVKYACNAFLATKISFINEMAQLAEVVKADIREIRHGMITDSRIGDQFLFPGIGYGGSCLPKDTHSLIAQAKKADTPVTIVQAVDEVNKRQSFWVINKLRDFFKNDLRGKVVAIWGLTFKPNTDDFRNAPSVKIISQLIQENVQLQVHDPVALPQVPRIFQKEVQSGKLKSSENPYEATQGADALLILTEWRDYRSPDFKRLKRHMKQNLIVDGRNIFDPDLVQAKGFHYYGVGQSRLS